MSVVLIKYVKICISAMERSFWEMLNFKHCTFRSKGKLGDPLLSHLDSLYVKFEYFIEHYILLLSAFDDLDLSWRSVSVAPQMPSYTTYPPVPQYKAVQFRENSLSCPAHPSTGFCCTRGGSLKQGVGTTGKPQKVTLSLETSDWQRNMRAGPTNLAAREEAGWLNRTQGVAKF